jgi:hypothetical protein
MVFLVDFLSVMKLEHPLCLPPSHAAGVLIFKTKSLPSDLPFSYRSKTCRSVAILGSRESQSIGFATVFNNLKVNLLERVSR